MRTKSVKKNKINVITLGCSKNTYDSEVLMGQLKASGKDIFLHSFLFRTTFVFVLGI